jgi:exodeoxyribonuclease III
LKLATWNVNSIRVRLPHVLDWLSQHRPDVLCLQETKTTDAEFPFEPLRSAGYHVAHVGQKAYNGVATLTRVAPSEVHDAPDGIDPDQKRVLVVTVQDVRVVNVYVPNGERVGSEKYAYKLHWLESLRRYLAGELARSTRLAVVGDFNIAPEARDVHDPDLWRNSVLFSEPERAALKRLMEVGLVDVFRRFHETPAHYSWWDYRAGSFRRNLGLRIDHIFCGEALAAVCRSCVIDKSPRGLERPSDHAPVVAEFDL